jgi:hypothetical protein
MEYEVISLASEGWFYNKDHPFSSGKAKIKPFCFNIEKILCNQNLKKRGEIDKEFIKNIVVEDVEFDSILNCDYETIILNSRILNYGKTGKYKISCPHCDVESQQDISFLFRGKPTPNPVKYGENGVKVGLSDGEHLVLKLPTVNEYRKFSEMNWLDYLQNITVSYSGGDHVSFIENGLSVKDSRHLRSLYKDDFPGFITSVELTCPSCGEAFKTGVEPNIDIFGFSPEYRKSVQEEMFDLCYHSEGTFQMDFVQDMSVSDRSFYINRLVETINKKNEAEQKAANAAKSGGGSRTVSPPPRVK